MADRMVREFFQYRPGNRILQFREEIGIGKDVDEEQAATDEQFVSVPVK